MRVVAHRPSSWFLVEDGTRLLLDVNCSHSAFGFSRLIELSVSERKSYEERGGAFLDELAERVNYRAMSIFAIRHLGPDVEKVVNEAVSAWRLSGG
jgi:hypothetical protein